jgi:hypothetical protein
MFLSSPIAGGINIRVYRRRWRETYNRWRHFFLSLPIGTGVDEKRLLTNPEVPIVDKFP